MKLPKLDVGLNLNQNQKLMEFRIDRLFNKTFLWKLLESNRNNHIVRINGLAGKIKGIITDRGKEFSKFEEMEKITGSNIYLCDPGKPQQKPLIEYMNFELREWYPKKTDFNNVTQQEIDWVVNDVINEKLRPVLNWRTSKEVFLENFR